jgi:hypothetical protein
LRLCGIWRLRTEYCAQNIIFDKKEKNGILRNVVNRGLEY